jgi:hypothetical protein
MAADNPRSPRTDRALATINPRFPVKSQLLRWFQESAIFLSSVESRQQLQRAIVNRRSGSFAAGLGSLFLLLWNAKLVFSTGAGMGTMMLLYLFQDEQWRKEKWPQLNGQLQQQLEGLNRPFLWSAIGGTGAAFFSYLALAAWAETDDHWLATGILLQGLLTVGVLGLGIRQWWMQDKIAENVEAIEFSHWVEKLSHEDPVSRLLAVRQLSTIAQSGSLTQQKEILDYFQLMLDRESEELIREAIWQGLEPLAPNLNLLAKTSEEFIVEPESTQAKIKAWVEKDV